MTTYKDLKYFQKYPLSIKISKTKALIREFYNEMGFSIFVSFSGGKDSTVLLHIVRSMYPETQAVFADTGLEFPEIRNFVKTFENVEILKPTKTYKQVLEEYGYPVISKEVANVIDGARKGQAYRLKRLDPNIKSRFNVSKYAYLMDAPFKISDRCCYHMKKSPIMKYIKKNQSYPIIGTMAEESILRTSAWIRTGCNIVGGNNPRSMLLSFWTEKDIWDYIKLNNLNIAKPYEMGYRRTGCIFCMFGAHLEKSPNRFQLLHKTHPKLWEYSMKDTKENGLGLSYILGYLNIPYCNEIGDERGLNEE